MADCRIILADSESHLGEQWAGSGFDRVDVLYLSASRADTVWRISVRRSFACNFSEPAEGIIGLAAVPIALYNGERGRNMEIFFYVGYPLLVLLLFLIVKWMPL